MSTILRFLIVLMGLGGIAFSGPPTVPERLLVEIGLRDGAPVILSLSRLPAGPLPEGDGDTIIRVLDAAGRVLTEARTDLPAFIAQEKFLDGGAIEGRLAPIAERRAVVVAMPAGASSIQALRRGLNGPAKSIGSIGIPRIAPAAPASSPHARFAPLLREQARLSPRGILAAAPAITGAGANALVRGTVAVKTVKDTSLFVAHITFYAMDGSGASFSVQSDAAGKFSLSLPRAPMQVVAHCYYRDPELGGIEFPLYPLPMIIPEYRPGSGPLNLKWKLNTLFKGQLLDEHGRGVAGEVYVIEKPDSPSVKQLWYSMAMYPWTDGNFRCRLPARAHAFVIIPYADSNVAEMVRIITVKKPKKGRQTRTVKIRLKEYGDAGGDTLKKIHDGGPTASRLNIVFLSEAYTDGMESFADLNGNGFWDGDIFPDDNGNGAWDAGEYYFDRNRNGVYDAPEPFSDANGDGICNRHERARFEADASMAAAALLNFRPFDEYRDAVNIWLHWAPSKHGIHKLTSYSRYQNMDTAFRVASSGTGGFQNSYIESNADAYVRALLPDAGTVVPVVLSQDRMRTLRANAMFNFGRVLLSAEDHRAGAVLIHELGHSIGSLADEYLYYGAPPTVAAAAWEPGYANLTAETDPTRVKWRDLFRGIPAVPTPVAWDGYGLFEGAASWSTGIYRPTAVSMMRSTSEPFFEVNNRRLREVLSAFRQ
jgi:hypothetical protein